jgi:radical SAM-linked protein
MAVVTVGWLRQTGDVSVNRALLMFSKTDKARFIGHLDLLRVFRRAIKIADLPVAYSEGFNPHQKLSIAVPLALGMEGYNEVLELELNDKHDINTADIKDRLNTALPKGVLIHTARFMGSDEKSPAAAVSAACYKMQTRHKDALYEKIQILTARESVIISKKTKRGFKDVDIRPDIISLEVSNDTLRAVLSAGGQRSLKPDLLANAIGISFCRCVRVDIYKAVNSKHLPIFSE